MKKIETRIDGASAKEFVKGSYILDYVAFGVSLLCIALYIIFGIKDGEWFSILELVMIIAGALLLVLAVSLFFMLNKSIKKANDFPRTITYEFEKDYFLYAVSRNEEVIENGKLLYSDLLCYKETKNYVYAELKNGSWFAIRKVDDIVNFLISKGLRKKNK